MTIPDVTTLLNLSGAVLLLAFATWFRDLSLDPVNSIKHPVAGGLMAGFATLMARHRGVEMESVVATTGIALVILYARRHSSDRDAVEAFALGTLIGWFASLPAALTLSGDPLLFPATLMAAGGFGWGALALFERQSAIPFFIRSAVAVAVCIATGVFARRIPQATGLSSEQFFQLVAVLAPLMLFVSPFARWRSIAAELQNETELGIYPEGEAARCAHPFRRFGRAGWRDRGTRRMFVRRSIQLAIRKRRARKLDAASARLHQWGILRLRMEIADLLRMGGVSGRSANSGIAETLTSDTMIGDHFE